MLPIADYDYNLPPDLIAQTPVEPRDHSRLLVLHRATGAIEHRHFYDILEYLRPGDMLVGNDSRVLHARLYGRKSSGGRTEALLLRQLDDLRWEALLKGKMPVGTQVEFVQKSEVRGQKSEGGQQTATDASAFSVQRSSLIATVEAILPSGGRVLRFGQPINDLLPQIGVMPTPPYITAPLDDPERYQTVYSAPVGSAAAPTAGLHWTPELIARAQAQGVEWATVTLHVGLDTFRPVQTDDAREHTMHSEWFELSAAAAATINRAREGGGRVIAVGTTSVRVLESVRKPKAPSRKPQAEDEQQDVGATAGARPKGYPGSYPASLNGERRTDARRLMPDAQSLAPTSGWTNIYIYPPYQFRVVDGLITNFHLPRSTLLLLVSALAGREHILHAYAEAVRQRYRFFSFGDAMLIV